MKTLEGQEWYKEVLEDNSSFLVEKLSLNALFFASMVTKKILTYQEVDDLEDEGVQSRRSWKLVKLLQKKSPRNFAAFLEVLRERGQRYIASKLCADARHKHRYNESERSAQENINKYVHMHLGQSTHISITEQKKFASELVLQKDYHYVSSVNKNLLQEIEELNDDLKDEKRDHQTTKDQLNDMIQQFKFQLNETQQANKRAENLEGEFKKSLQKIQALQLQNAELREELNRLSLDTVDRQQHREQSDDAVEEMKETHKKEVEELSEQLGRLQKTIKEQEQQLSTMNSKVHAIVNDIPREKSDSTEDEPKKVSTLECLNQILSYVSSATKSTFKTSKESKESSKEKRKQLLKQLEEMTSTMQDRQGHWEREREEANKREKAMQRNLNIYKQDIANLKKKVEQLSTPTPDSRARSDSLTSLTALPQVDMMQRSFMVSTNQQHPSKKMKRQASNDTVTSLPHFKPPKVSSTTLSGHLGGLPLGNKNLQCTQCFLKINQTELMTTTCKHHDGSFNQVRQKWLCCNNPYRHPGCKGGRHQVKQ